MSQKGSSLWNIQRFLQKSTGAPNTIDRMFGTLSLSQEAPQNPRTPVHRIGLSDAGSGRSGFLWLGIASPLNARRRTLLVMAKRRKAKRCTVLTILMYKDCRCHDNPNRAKAGILVWPNELTPVRDESSVSSTRKISERQTIQVCCTLVVGQMCFDPLGHFVGWADLHVAMC